MPSAGPAGRQGLFDWKGIFLDKGRSHCLDAECHACRFQCRNIKHGFYDLANAKAVSSALVRALQWC